MKKRSVTSCGVLSHAFVLSLLMTFTLLLTDVFLNAQCVSTPGTIEGRVFRDLNFNGVIDPGEIGISNVLISVQDTSGNTVGNFYTDTGGNYLISGLVNGSEYRLVFVDNDGLEGTPVGKDNFTRVQYIQVPECNRSVGLLHPDHTCGSNPPIATTCFVQGEITENSNMETIVFLDYQFNSLSPVNKFAMHGETGSIWGIAWKASSKEIFTSAFIKQYSGLTPHGHGAILKTSIGGPGMPSTSLFAKIQDLGVDVGNLHTTDINDCNYGAQVGKYGLGQLIISPDEKFLYVTNLYKKSIVRIDSENPTASTTKEYLVPNPGCSNGDYAVFALRYHKNKIYVGVTCTAETSRNSNESSANVYEFDPQTEVFNLIFTTNYIKGFWRDDQPASFETQHWLTDIAFTDDGNMILSLSDRIGHRFCRDNRRLDFQNPDILLVWNDNGTWRLENNGTAGPLTGAGVGNGQGPGGGEFFAFDHWPANPTYHPEVALGSVFVVPGSGSVVATVYDPEINSYSGGLHRYSTVNGQLLGTRELYVRNVDQLFGKASGFGGLVALCEPQNIEVGNHVWLDTDKNGLHDSGEDPVQGLTLHLLNEDCEILQSTTTDANGEYYFDQLKNGQNYQIAIDQNQFDGLSKVIYWNSQAYKLTQNIPSTGIYHFINSKAKWNVGNCPGSIIEFTASHTDHHQDIGLVKANDFDLTIHKEIVGSEFIQVEDTVTFLIRVKNIGGIAAKTINVKEVIPEGYEFLPELNPAWTLEGNVATQKINSILLPGDEVQLFIDLKVLDAPNNVYRNHVEIEESIDILDSLHRDDDDFDDYEPKIFRISYRQEGGVSACQGSDSEIIITHHITNTGNEPISSFSLNNEISPHLLFNSLQNPGWTFQNGKYLFKGGAIAPGAKHEVSIKFSIVGDHGDFVHNIGSVSNILPQNADALYFYGSEDAEQGLSFDLDLGSINNLSLSVSSSKDKTFIHNGEHFTMFNKIENIGGVRVKKLELVLKADPSIEILSQGWVLVQDNKYKKELIFDDGFSPGQEWHEQVEMRLAGNSSKYYYDNMICIQAVEDDCGQVLSMGNPFELVGPIALPFMSEDPDFGPQVGFIRLYSLDATVGDCMCLNNATNLGNGQFSQTIVITSVSGLNLYVDQAVNFFSTSSPAPPAPPTPFVTGIGGQMLTETVVDMMNNISQYELTGIFYTGQYFTVRIRSGQFDIIQITGGGCTYSSLPINGLGSLCRDATATYSVQSIPGATYNWSLSGGGMIVGSGSSIEVIWDNIPGVYTLSVQPQIADQCIAPSSIQVAVGDAHNGLACNGHVNVSLDGRCEATIVPQMLVAGSLLPDVPYSVMVMNEDGSLIPNNIVTAEHIGKKIMAKLIEGCSGNTCWATVTVEDKRRPVFTCDTIDLACYKLDQYPGPIVLDNCDHPIEPILLNSTETKLNCDPDYLKRVVRTYTAVDKSGNFANECTQTINILRPDFSEIVLPINRSMMNGNPLQCDNIPLDNNGMPDPMVTGVPTINGVALYPNLDDDCSIAVGYSDVDLGYVDCVRKIRRRWTIFEWWCDGGQMLNHEQIIEIVDNIAPSIKCSPNTTVSASEHQCMGLAQLSPPTVSDNCNGPIRVDITTPVGFFENQTSASILLPVGTHSITYRAYDRCLNSSSCSMTVVVEDKTTPSAICETFHAIALNFFGQAHAYANVFDAGSYDACGIDYMEVRRMDGGANCGLDEPDFGDLVNFCCADVGANVPVELRVVDYSGNSNTCMVNVEVQDKFPPQIQCPAPVTINCGTEYDLEDLSEYGVATALDACPVEIEEEQPIVSLTTCKTGTITRNFVATDGNGSATCSQTISIIKENIFSSADITWPEDYATDESCRVEDLLPENLPEGQNFPILRPGACDQVAYSYKDEYFSFEDGNNSCFKIIRKWKVIDWCRIYETGYTPFVYDQIIKVSNRVAPEITSSLERREFCNSDQDCDNGAVQLSVTAEDDCTPDNNLRWRYQIDLNRDGSIDLTNQGFGNLATLNATLPVGEHSILWSFEDMCGNTVAREQIFAVVNCVKPSIVCIHGIAVSIEPMDTDGDNIPDEEMACITPDSFPVSVMHPCGFDVDYSFDLEGLDTLCFGCFDIGINDIIVIVTDEFGNTASCSTYVDVQDNNDVTLCPDLEMCIIWPVDVTIEDCGISPDPTIVGEPVIVTECPCQDFQITFTDENFDEPNDDCIIIRRTWSATAMCLNTTITYTHIQTIRRLNVFPPSIICPPSVTVEANGTQQGCFGQVSLDDATAVFGDCNSNVVITHNSSFANAQGPNASGSYPVGTTVVIFTVSDGCSNTNTCSITVTVNDGRAPVCVTNDYTLILDQLGNGTITGQDVAGGSFDECGTITTITVNPSQFNCGNLGENTVTIVVTDNSGNTTTCTATVTVVDEVPPICMTRDITVTLDQNGNASITAQQIDNGSSDPCGQITNLSVTPSIFNCNNLGQNVVVLTVTDNSNNTSSCTAIVTVRDEIAPVCQLRDITINIEGGSTVTLDAFLLDDGSFDPCGTIVSFTSDPSVFGCEDLGQNTVVVTVTDNSGNTTTCTATVTVTENSAPVCVPQDITVSIVDTNPVTITPEQVDGGSFDPCGEIVSRQVNPNTFDCTNIGQNTVILTVTDNSGNSTTCSATVTVRDNVAPTCRLRPLSVVIGPSLSITINPDSLDDGSTDDCGTIVGFTADRTTFTCPDIGQVIVTVTVTDNSGNTTTCTTTVTVTDEVAPICQTQNRTLILTDLNPVTVADNFFDNGSFDPCGNIVNISVTPNTFDCGNLGVTTVVMTVTDNSGNTSSCTATITITDQIAPECILRDITVNFEGQPVVIQGSDLDNGSYDPCGQIVSFEVDPDTFGCDEIGENIVTVTITDNNGNTTTCTTTVTVVDSSQLICETIDITVSLDINGEVMITPDMIDNGSSATCGDDFTLTVSPDRFFCNDQGDQVVTLTVTTNSGNSLSCTAIVTVVDDLPPTLICPDNLDIPCDEYEVGMSFGSFSVEDNCTPFVEVDSIEIFVLNTCNIGIITRTFTASDNANNSTQCVQVINVTGPDVVFDETRVIVPADTIYLTDCVDLDPAVIPDGELIINTDGLVCFLLSISYEDTNLTEDSLCQDTITRTWTVVDSCQLDGTGAGIFTFVQTIIVNDQTPPVISIVQDTVSVVASADSCFAYVDLSANVQVEDCNFTVTVTNDSPFADDNNSPDASGTYPVGVTIVTITATDNCGNTASSTFAVYVIDEFNYIFACTKLFRDIGEDGTVSVVSREHTRVVGNCVEYRNIQFSYSPTDKNDTVRIYDCSQLGPDSIWVYMWLDCQLVDSCYTENFITDNDSICSGMGGLAEVVGNIYSSRGLPIRSVEVELDGSDLPMVMTDEQGRYKFPRMPSGGEYTVKSHKNDDPRNGITTLDLILIQQHILQSKLIDNPYDLIAADINRDGKITGADLVELRKLILGIIPNFSKNTSWRFLDKTHQFENPDNPLLEFLPESYHIIELTEGRMRVDFTGIKVGDINGSVNPDLLSNQTDSRNASMVAFAQDKFVSKSEPVVLNINTPEIMSVYGLQLGLKTQVEMVSMESEVFDESELAYHVSGDVLNISVVSPEARPIGGDKALLTIRFNAPFEGYISEMISFRNNKVSNEIYPHLNNYALELRWAKANDDYSLIGNVSPNPWKDRMSIEVQSLYPQQIQLDALDISGKKVLSKTISVSKGTHTVEILRNEILVGGVYFLDVTANGVKERRKMIVLD